MLHITNGHATADKLAQANLPGRVVVWADVLHEGPCPTGLSPEDWRKTRADFLASCGWFTPEKNLATLRQWDADLASFAREDQTVLWFEHDLFDQIILIHHLNFFAHAGADSSKLHLVCIDRHADVPNFRGLGQLSPSQLADLFPTRQPITPRQLDIGLRAWHAFTSPDPRKIEESLQGDTDALPFLAPALHRHLAEFPSTSNGLGRTDHQILASLSDSPRAASDLFFACMSLEEAPFLGDTTFFHHVDNLAAPPHPLLTTHLPTTNATQVAITDLGRQVLAGQIDALSLHPLDRWLGGVHLSHDHPAWRWNISQRRLQPAP